MQQAAPSITHCTFDRTNWGVYLNGVSNPSLDSCLFRNLTYAPMQTSLVSYPKSTLSDSISGTTYRGIGVLNNETFVQDTTISKKNFAGYKNIPYLFQNYTIATNAVLTVEPGVIVKFFPGTGMTVNKGLMAVGGSTPDRYDYLHGFARRLLWRRLKCRQHSFVAYHIYLSTRLASRLERDYIH